ncbi:hypothetical protein BU24DRAFT_449994 [Aaosphaeria arxii CBS 175.79]|uniref:DUF3500 domain-containing protein n=1 Tax=Aaosphaeria arxii CBS 175.79 TaxID=1450172 RepID=A0A6A5XQR8_9PLEO|nr:uncharacterized protein BU24DRAFT_449994 [Aaosphaeria arxii CBS 175.79]KAF2015239.1 hypothetical protein BU24DRAFT_449994 [Aaosphaeria arxii CBS 175.79]
MAECSSSFQQDSSEFRAHLHDLSTPRFTTAAEQNVYEYADFFRDNHAPPWLFDLTQAWAKLYEEPFKGVTSDGTVKEGVFEPQDEGVDIDSIVHEANLLLSQLSADEKTKLSYKVNAKEWRAWSNPEMLLRPFGLRLEEVTEENAQAILSVIKASLSPEGYEKALAAMRINHFLGELVRLPQIMNKYSYNFLLFGSPSTSPTQPWGWLLYGHHLCLSVFFKGPQIIISPTFTGAEPNIIDEGEWSGTKILHKEGNLGLQLMQSLSLDQQKQAQIFKNLRDDGMQQTGDLITDRWNKDDQRHLCGAFRDNRIVPYEGIKVSTLNEEQQSLILSIAEQFVLYLPSPSRALRLEQVQSHFEETYFSWIGGFGDDDAYYFRIQSPVIICEFDHHSGVFLANTEPKKFHTHTIVRTPNAGDYGQALREGESRL